MISFRPDSGFAGVEVPTIMAFQRQMVKPKDHQTFGERYDVRYAIINGVFAAVGATIGTIVATVVLDKVFGIKK